MKIVTSFLFCFLAFGAMKMQAQAPDWQWAVQSGDQGSFGNVTPRQMAIDPGGNIYLLGQFNSVAILGDSTFSNPKFLGGTADIFLVKYNSEGKVLWAKHPAGHVNFYHSAMAIDSAGSVYFGGIADSIIDFGKGITTDTGSFIVKYDSGGSPRWVKHIGIAIKTDTTFFSSADIAVLGCDNRNQLYAVLYLRDSLQLDEIRIPKDTNTPFVIAQINSDGKTQRMRPEVLKGNLTQLYINCISVVNNVESPIIYLAGEIITDTVYFDRNLFVRGKSNYGRYQAFLARYEINGCAWVKNIERQDKYYVEGGPTGICSSGGSLYVAGNFRIDSLNFTDTIHNGSESFQYYGFLAKYDEQGTVRWVVRFWSLPPYLYQWETNINTSGVSVDPQGNAYLSGIFKTTMEIAGDTLFLQSPSSYPANLFEAKFDKDGKSLWIQQAGGTPVSTIQAFYKGNPYLSGCFDGSMTLGSIQLAQADDNQALFLAKLGSVPSAVRSNSKSAENPLTLFPNPASTQATVNFTLTKPGIVNIEIFDLLGRRMKEISLDQQNVGEHSEALDLREIPNGTYISKMIQTGEVTTQVFQVLK